ncbi:MAG TPA: sugar ABC transporter permease [Candidatus Atribacteria bacterium]|nr:sugar ABC transporter permease [Candidatus Atribacteria bacterium]HCU23158.1 sugar ABC transporter permease [Candidatus Atribacteria bacterium]
MKKDWLTGYSFTLPSIILLIILVIYPLFLTLNYSLSDMSLTSSRFLGWTAYNKLFGNKMLPLVFKNSIIWTVLVVFFQLLLGLGSAIVLNKPFWGRSLVRGIMILPWVMPGVVAGMVWRLIYDPQLGLLNHYLKSLGLIDQYLTWLSVPGSAIYAVIFSAIWKGFPFSMLMYLAGLQGVPSELYEAANIDGAGKWKQFRYVTLPSMQPIITITFLLTFIWTFNYFELIYVMTGGGPAESTHIFPTYVYDLAFKRFRFGDASRFAIFDFLFLLIFSLFYVWLSQHQKGAEQ